MTKESFLKEVEKLNDQVNWNGIARHLGVHNNTVLNYRMGVSGNVDMMAKILQAAYSQIQTKIELLQALQTNN